MKLSKLLQFIPSETVVSIVLYFKADWREVENVYIGKVESIPIKYANYKLFGIEGLNDPVNYDGLEITLFGKG